MTRWIAALLALVAAPSAAQTLSFEGHFTQGGLVIGRTEPGASVRFGERLMRVAADGVFVLGFGRDSAPQSLVEVVLPGGAMLRRMLDIAPRSFDIQRINGLPANQVNPSAEEMARIRTEAALIREARARDTGEPFFKSGFIWPAQGRISGVYGSQRILNGEARQPHYGVDIAAPTGTPVVAPAAGVIAIAHPDMFFTGKTILIDHGHGLVSDMLHFDAIEVKPGDRVAQGQPIGRIGATGRVTGPHLHWGLTLFDVRLDPQLLLPPMPAPNGG